MLLSSNFDYHKSKPGPLPRNASSFPPHEFSYNWCVCVQVFLVPFLWYVKHSGADNFTHWCVDFQQPFIALEQWYYICSILRLTWITGGEGHPSRNQIISLSAARMCKDVTFNNPSVSILQTIFPPMSHILIMAKYRNRFCEGDFFYVHLIMSYVLERS